MSIDDIKTPDYRKKRKYDNLSISERALKESQDALKNALHYRAVLEQFSQDDIRTSFNCPGFRGVGYSAEPLYDKGEYLEKYYKPPIDYKGNLIIKLQVLNRKRLAIHSINITWTKEPFRSIDKANELKVYTFKKGKGQDGLNFYIQEPNYKAKRVYAGSILYNDEKLSNSVKYAIRELYLYGLTLQSIANIMKYITSYKGENNIFLKVNI